MCSFIPCISCKLPLGLEALSVQVQMGAYFEGGPRVSYCSILKIHNVSVSVFLLKIAPQVFVL